MDDIRPIDANALAEEFRHESLDAGFYRAIYEGAARRAEAAPTLDYVPRQQWISVKDGTPKEWKAADGTLNNYLVFMPEYGVDVGNYLATAKTWVCMGLPVKVTHWMPLPEAPKEE